MVRGMVMVVAVEYTSTVWISEQGCTTSLLADAQARDNLQLIIAPINQ
jgi:hypothetical protein